jgi:hypothetical protein
MHAMTANTGRNFLVSRLQQLAMDAAGILLLLIHSQSRVKLFHETGVIVTLAAEGRDVDRSGPSQVTFSRILCRDLIVLCWISSMAIVT